MNNTTINLKVTELTTTEPVTLAEAKRQCIVDFTDDDTYLTELITQCRRAVENYTHVSLISKRIIWTVLLCNELEFPHGPVIGIEAVDTPAGNPGSGPVPYEPASGSWQVDGEDFKTFIPNGQVRGDWPDDHWGRQRDLLYRKGYEPTGQRYRITYTVGYSTCPSDLKLAILNEIAYRYEHRGDEVIDGICEAAQKLSQPYLRTAWQ